MTPPSSSSSSSFSLVSLYAAFLRRCFAGAGLSQQILALDDGESRTTLHFWGPLSRSSSPPRPALLLLHGFGPSAIFQWRRQVTFLAPHFDLYVPDLLFFGGSATASAERSEVFQAECVAKLMERVGVERYSVAGTSYGGFVAYRVAEREGERVEKVVIASSAVNMVRGDNENLLRRGKMERVEDLMLPSTAEQMRALLGLAMNKHRQLSSLIPNFLLNDFIRELYSGNRVEKMELLKGLSIGRDDTPKISPLNQEVMIIWGEHDQIFPVEKANQLKEFLGERARLEIIKNTSHAPQIEDSHKFNHIVKNFLCAAPASS